MKVVFMGTPTFACPTLKTLLESPHHIVGIYTQPDKPKGRGKAMAFSPVKALALEAGIPVFQPPSIRIENEVKKLRALMPDVIIVAAYGQILSQEILDIPPYGCLNVHASLLPKYRGAAPIEWAIIDGEKTTGITIMRMEAGLDTGPMLLKEEVEILPEDTGASLHDRLMVLGGPMICQALTQLENNTAVFTPQDNAKSCYAHMLDKKLGNINFNKSALELERFIRGLNPWPGCYTFWQGKQLKIWKSLVNSQKEKGTHAPGTILWAGPDQIGVQTGNGILEILEVQLEGKKRMSVAAFLLGTPLKAGEHFTTKKEEEAYLC